MIRSGSKLLKKGGSVRNINKVGSKFRFVIEFESADKLLTNSDVVATCERKGVVLSTSAVAVDTKTRSVSFEKEKLEQLVTLFKPKKGGIESFHEKPYSFCIRSHNDQGKIIGKAFLNFSEYVGVPDCSKRISLPLSHDGSLIMRITSIYVGEARRKSKKSSGGASSVISSSTIGAVSSKNTNNTPDNRSDYEKADQSDLSDLLIDDDFEGIKSSSSAVNIRPQKDIAPSQSRKKIDSSRSTSRITSSQPRLNQTFILAPSQSRPRERARENESRRSVETPAETSVAVRPKSSVETVSQADYDQLKRDNRALVRKNNDISMRNDQLEDKFVTLEVDKIQVLEDQVEDLKKELRELKEELAREPVYLDVVKELKDAKMCLAILSTENAELKMKRQYQEL